MLQDHSDHIHHTCKPTVLWVLYPVRLVLDTIVTRLLHACVAVQVYICDGTRVLKGHVKAELEMLKLLGRPLVVLTDPDERGR